MARRQSPWRLAGQATALACLDALDLGVLAESQVLSLLTAAQTQALPECELMRRADPADRPALRAALDRLARQGAIDRIDGPDGENPSWRLTPAPAGHW